jgi:hypothetical protein
VVIKEVLTKLRPEETLRLTRILLDEDKDEAMLFLKQCLRPQLDRATRDHECLSLRLRIGLIKQTALGKAAIRAMARGRLNHEEPD